jgi:broad specificity phosphatase PhoE
MLNIYLTRHGQDEDNCQGILNGHRNCPLTEVGVGQAKELAKNIKSSNIKFDKILSSPLKRTFQTAKIIAQYLDSQELEIMDLLIERNFGIMTGQPVMKIKEMCSPDILETEKITYFLSPAGAETFPQLLERGRKVVGEITNRYKEGNILLVTHGDIGKMIYAAYYNLDWKKVLTMFHFGNSDLLLLSSQSPVEEAHAFKTSQYNH